MVALEREMGKQLAENKKLLESLSLLKDIKDSRLLSVGTGFFLLLLLYTAATIQKLTRSQLLSKSTLKYHDEC